MSTISCHRRRRNMKDPCSRFSRGTPEKGAPFRKARLLENGQVMPPVKSCVVAIGGRADHPHMFAQDSSFGGDHRDVQDPASHQPVNDVEIRSDCVRADQTVVGGYPLRWAFSTKPMRGTVSELLVPASNVSNVPCNAEVDSFS
jgi:hypothetical protein